MAVHGDGEDFPMMLPRGTAGPHRCCALCTSKRAFPRQKETGPWPGPCRPGCLLGRPPAFQGGRQPQSRHSCDVDNPGNDEGDLGQRDEGFRDHQSLAHRLMAGMSAGPNVVVVWRTPGSLRTADTSGQGPAPGESSRGTPGQGCAWRHEQLWPRCRRHRDPSTTGRT
jgi:hypothetical protein